MLYEELSSTEIGNLTNYICKFKDNMIFSTFILKENSCSISKIKNNLTLELKNISYFSNGQAAFLILFKFSDNDKLIYGRWFNYADKNHRENLEMLLFQNEIPITIVDENNKSICTVWCSNILKDGIKQHIKKASRLHIESTKFKEFTSSIESKFKNIIDIWKESKID
ncbi:hypothetical protein [Clostridium chauvoei]|uniref:Uncharacterized protein n=2 Tax=Clostridium chauvoei TaxID=46867 RepID=S6F9L5_9CLOT|nr:hypothetical protein [Clostridium chauvoei]ATD55086.1 hypothetical protein BTM20_07480 [Clostridium chauvoei]ATD57240.1 hypothetical protein BTM21_05575 [Clostridium chauvoei]MBX7279430.1 hypothetical protein [Clostridium chauvoei]MBX7282484.1 hypothetical protein [Clostridium chauvoei]MBX7285629.1 hypothetical protein [Clostridium chauvoei]